MLENLTSIDTIKIYNTTHYNSNELANIIQKQLGINLLNLDRMDSHDKRKRDKTIKVSQVKWRN